MLDHNNMKKLEKEFRCICRDKNSKGTTISVSLVDRQGNKTTLTAAEVKAGLKDGSMDIVNLKLDKAGRLIEKDCKTEEYMTEYNKIAAEFMDMFNSGKPIVLTRVINKDTKEVVVKTNNVQLNDRLNNLLWHNNENISDFIIGKIVGDELVGKKHYVIYTIMENSNEIKLVYVISNSIDNCKIDISGYELHEIRHIWVCKEDETCKDYKDIQYYNNIPMTCDSEYCVTVINEELRFIETPEIPDEVAYFVEQYNNELNKSIKDEMLNSITLKNSNTCNYFMSLIDDIKQQALSSHCILNLGKYDYDNNIPLSVAYFWAKTNCSADILYELFNRAADDDKLGFINVIYNKKSRDCWMLTANDEYGVIFIQDNVIDCTRGLYVPINILIDDNTIEVDSNERGEAMFIRYRAQANGKEEMYYRGAVLHYARKYMAEKKLDNKEAALRHVICKTPFGVNIFQRNYMAIKYGVVNNLDKYIDMTIEELSQYM